MGNKSSKKNTTQIVNSSSNIISNKVEKIEKKQEELINIFKNDKIDAKTFNELNTLAELSKNQLNRQDLPLTKNDLIAILVRLNPVMLKDIDMISKNYSVKDLNRLIRSIIYDVSPSESKKSNIMEDVRQKFNIIKN